MRLGWKFVISQCSLEERVLSSRNSDDSTYTPIIPLDYVSKSSSNLPNFERQVYVLKHTSIQSYQILFNNHGRVGLPLML